MYNIEELVGKVVTIKTSNAEYVALLNGVDEELTTLTLENPQLVMIQGGDVLLMPFVLTAEPQQVFMSTNDVLAVMESLEATAKDYLEISEEVEEVEEVEVEEEPEQEDE